MEPKKSFRCQSYIDEALQQSLGSFIEVNMLDRLKHVWKNITIEPVVAMYCLIIALSGIPGEELYLKKACKVNLNHTMEVCDNIHDHEEAQIATQKLVSGVQARQICLTRTT